MSNAPYPLNDVAQCSNRNTLHNVPVGTFQRYVPTGTFNPVFQPEHSKPFLDSHTHPLSNSNIQDAINVPTGTFKPFAQTSIMKNCASVPTGTFGRVLHTIQLPDGNSTLHSKHESHYSANSSGSSTIYGTRHCCCQSEGRRGQDYDCHQPSRVFRSR